MKEENKDCAVGAGSADWARIDKLKAEIKELDHQRKLRESEINGILIARMTRARYRQPNIPVTDAEPKTPADTRAQGPRSV